MSIQRRLMKPGQFTIKLRDDTRYGVFGQIAEGDHIVVTPTRLLPIDGYADADILAAAWCTLVITKFTPPGDIQGADLTWWMGTPRGLGAGTTGTQGLLTTPVTQSAATLSTWVSALCPPSLSVGTVTNGALPTLTASYQGVTRREALDAVCRAVGAEYRVNPDFTIDAAAPTTLFTSSPTVVVTRKGEGRDTGRDGVDGSVIATTGDIEDFTSKAIVVTKGEGSAATFTTVTGSQLFRDGRNNLVHMERYIDVPTEVAANASLIGTAVLGKYNAKRRDLRLSSNTYNVSRMVEPGDYVYVYDPLQGLTDPANQIVYRDEVMSPLMLRVYGLTIPVQNGMGVYLRKSTGSSYTYVDLTDVVVWETGEVSWEVGAVRRGLGSGPAVASVESTAYLGANPTVAARVAGTGERPTYSCTMKAGGAAISLGNGTLTARVLVEDGHANITIEHVLGTTTSYGAGGALSFTLPSGFLPASDVIGFPVGQVTIVDGTTPYNRYVSLSGSSELLMFSEAGAQVTNTVPFSMGAGDYFRLTARYPIV